MVRVRYQPTVADTEIRQIHRKRHGSSKYLSDTSRDPPQSRAPSSRLTPLESTCSWFVAKQRPSSKVARFENRRV